MSTFVQHNKGNAKGTQTFDSKDAHLFKQYGGGTQIIDGVVTHTQVVNDNQVGIQRGEEPGAHYVQVNSGIAFQSPNMTFK